MRTAGPRASTVLIAAAFVVAMLGTTMPTPLYPEYQADFGFTRLVVTVVFATYAAGVLIALLLTGDLADRIGYRRTLMPALAAAALSGVCFLLADGLPLVLLGRLLSGLCAGVFTGTATAALVALAPEDGRDRASVIATIANMGGLGLGPVFAGVVAETLPDPLRTPYLLHLAMVVVVGVGLLALPDPHPGGRFALRPTRLAVPRVVRRDFVRAAVASSAGFAVLGLYNSVAPSFLGELLEVRHAAAIGLVASSIFGASVVGQLLRGRASDPVALIGGCALLTVGMVALGTAIHVGSLLLVVVAALLAGTGQGLSFSAGVALISTGVPPEDRTAVTSTLFVITYVATSLPAVGVGLLAQATDLVTAGTAIVVVVAVLAAGAGLSRARAR